MGGGPTGLVTARGAGDLLTRITWILFGLFLALSLGLDAAGGARPGDLVDRRKLKLQHANPNELNQPLTPPPSGSVGTRAHARFAGAPPVHRRPNHWPRRRRSR
ncbi:MAG: preprotein translocase subunit SecG [Caulobacteraceae bacterium]